MDGTRRDGTGRDGTGRGGMGRDVTGRDGPSYSHVRAPVRACMRMLMCVRAWGFRGIVTGLVSD